MKVEDFWSDEMVKVPRKVKKSATRAGCVVTARMTRKQWLTAPKESQQ